MKWYQKTGWIIILLIFFFPVGLFLMWKYTNWNKIAKGTVTGLFAVAVITNIVNGPPIEAPAQASADPSGGTSSAQLTQSESPISSSIAAVSVESSIAEPSVAKPEAIAAPKAVAIPDGEMRVHFLDVGQADSIFIELPDEESMLIDAGDIGGGSAILGYIKGLGYTSIDYVVATHPHADHIGGMADIINGIEIKSFYMPKVTHTSQTFEDMVDAIAAKGLKINIATAGKSIQGSAGVTMEFVAPVGTDYQSLNDYSAVLKLTYGAKSFLFTGDAEALSEAQITADVNADVLKVGHHGSDTSTSTAFLKKVSPEYAVISVGTGNTYGHPAEITLQALTGAGATIYRTDLDSTVVFSTDGNVITVDKKASPVKPAAPPASVVSESDASSAVVSESNASSAVTSENASNPVNINSEGNKQENVSYVWATATGKRYHRIPNCGNTKNAYEVPLDRATSMGLTACSKCY